MTTPTPPEPLPAGPPAGTGGTAGPADEQPPAPAPPPPPAAPPPPEAPPPPYGETVLPAAAPPPGGAVSAPVQSDETLWAVLAHLSYFVIPLIGPLVIMLAVGQQRPFARANAVEALNFHLTLFVASIVAVILVFVIIGIFLIIAIAIWGVVLTIIAAVKAGQGEGFRYPLTVRLVS